jgi:protein required for attachment to host cells
LDRARQIIRTSTYSQRRMACVRFVEREPHWQENGMARTSASTAKRAAPPLAYPRWPRTCVVVADAGSARVLEATRRPTAGGRPGAIRFDEMLRLENPAARLSARELVTDDTGRVFDSGSRVGHGPKSHARHGAQSDYDPHDVEVERFARRLGLRLDAERRRGGIEKLIVIAAPRFLGTLRQQLPAATRRLVTREIHRDLVRASDQTISRAAFSGTG